MMFYLLVLVLGLMFIYTLRDAILVLQERRERAEEMENRHATTPADYIIIQNKENCKRAG